ncbi:heterokaryon incompatibility protein [Colletotrichum orchidophilum]|uniref:Heterokaryon incompatibility protein n=1 Tax=Colletotrichum orchidophilum TaxID=1209926 RepID=A0A1G4BRT4_9PEZI|nr:heterokaryon incompatibility protein [Colletotrichum orchidophilum]OHF04098.1 heterokaryon incompatibility protein [Colletotrichum orchidophilum]
MPQTPQRYLNSRTLGQCPFCGGLRPRKSSQGQGSGPLDLIIVDLRLVRSQSTDGCAGCCVIEKALTYLSPGWRNFTNRRKCDKCQPENFRLCRMGDCAESAFALLPLGETIELCYPYRILDDLAAGPSRNLELFITEGNDHRDYGIYACLSYTWGQQNTGVTTLENLQVRLEGIVFENLPQTYKDAIKVATALDIPFLWIDGLCIIQGDIDSKDWAEQSSRMAEIYGDAVLVIAAADSDCVDDGFLSTTQSSRTFIEFECSDPDNWDTRDERTPIWCFQEEVLASRLLTFFGGEMNFQCLEDEYRCECAFPASPLGLVTIKELYEPRLQLGDLETPNWMWQSTVEHYTRRKLTMATDRLTALSGVARIVELSLGTKYAAGHWLDRDFLCSLCWAPVRTRETERTFSHDYIAPSWSWAAHNGPITMWIPYGGSEEPVTPRYLDKTVVRNVSIIPATQDDAGAVIGGSITVSGIFLDVSVQITLEKQSAGVMRRNTETVPFYFDRPTGAVSDRDKYFCWVVCILPNTTADKQRSGTYCLMVLRSKPGGPAHICERVGFADFDTTASDPAMRFFKGYRDSIRTAVIV